MGEQLPILEIKYNIELLLLFSIFESAKFYTREQVSEKFHVRLGHGLLRNTCRCSGAWRYQKIGRGFRKVCALFLLYLIMKKFFTLILLSMIAFNAIHAEITWTLSDDGTLIISGTDMPD